MATETDLTKDEQLAIEFIHGQIVERDGHVLVKHLSPREEKCAQEALVRLLRSHTPLHSAVRWALAGLLDPDSGNPRKLVLANKRKGVQPNPTRDYLVAVEIAACRKARGKMEATIRSLQDRHGLSRAQILRIWKREKQSPLIASI